MPSRYRVLFVVVCLLQYLIVVAAAVFVLRPARSCEIATANVFYECYIRRRGIVYLRARMAVECKQEP